MGDAHEDRPVVEAHGLRITGDGAGEVDRTDAADERSLTISFPPGTPAGRLDVTYRPPEEGGDPEVELHGFTRWSDVRLKRAVRPL